MFHRIALVPIGMLEKPAGNKLVFAAEGTNEKVSFDYRPEDSVYFRCRAITADASNGNGDFFPEEELKKSYKSFIGVGLYKDHDSGSVDKSVGKVLWAEWIPDGKYVECYCSLDKKLAPDLAHRVKNGIVDSVSMGCAVAEAECSICGNVAHNVNELCLHMTPGGGVKGRKNPDGSTIYEINRGIQFNELSLVTVPADSTARVFEIYAALSKKAADEKEASEEDKQKKKAANPLLRDQDAAYSKMFTEWHKKRLEELEDQRERMFAAGADQSSKEYTDVMDDIKWLNDLSAAKILAANYMRLSTPMRLVMYDQYDKMKNEGVQDKDNPFADAAADRENFAKMLEEQGRANDGMNIYDPGAYGYFLRWLMHSDLPVGVFGEYSRLRDEFKDGQDPNDTSNEANDTVMFRRNYVEAREHGRFTGMMLPKDFENHSNEVRQAFRQPAFKAIPTRLDAARRNAAHADLTRYFSIIDEIQRLYTMAASGDSELTEVDLNKKVLALHQEALACKSFLRTIPSDTMSEKSVWEVVLDLNKAYLGLRRKDPEVKSFLRVEEPPKEAPLGLNNMSHRDDAVSQYLQVKNSKARKVYEKLKDRGLPLEKDELMKQILRDNGIDEEKYAKAMKAQGVDWEWQGISDTLATAIHDNYYEGKPFTKGQQIYLNKLLEKEGITIEDGAKFGELETEGRDPEKNRWANSYPKLMSDEDKRAKAAKDREKRDDAKGKASDVTYVVKKQINKLIDVLYVGAAVDLGRRGVMRDYDLAKIDSDRWNVPHLVVYDSAEKDMPRKLSAIDALIAEGLALDKSGNLFKEAPIRDRIKKVQDAVRQKYANFIASPAGVEVKGRYEQFKARTEKAEASSERLKKLVESHEQAGVGDTTQVNGIKGNIKYPEFAEVVESIARKIVASKPFFRDNTIPADDAINWEMLRANIRDLDNILAGAPEIWRKVVFSERPNALAAVRFSNRVRAISGEKSESVAKTKRANDNKRAIEAATDKMREYLLIGMDEVRKLPQDEHKYLRERFSEYAKNREKIARLSQAYDLGSARDAGEDIEGVVRYNLRGDNATAQETEAIVYYMVLRELGEHLQSISFSSSDSDKALRDAPATRGQSLADIEDPSLEQQDLDEQYARTQEASGWNLPVKKTEHGKGGMNTWWEVLIGGSPQSFNTREEAMEAMQAAVDAAMSAGPDKDKPQGGMFKAAPVPKGSTKKQMEEYESTKKKIRTGEEPNPFKGPGAKPSGGGTWVSRMELTPDEQIELKEKWVPGEEESVPTGPSLSSVDHTPPDYPFTPTVHGDVFESDQQRAQREESEAARKKNIEEGDKRRLEAEKERAQRAADEEARIKKQLAEWREKKKKLGPTSSSVAIMHNKSEAMNMGLKISFTKGKDLKASFFEAKDGNAMYRVAASEVLPLVVQEAINHNDPDVSTPDMLIEDLQAKYESLHDFKRWAKRRRSKNKKAFEKFKKADDQQKDSKSNVAESTGRNNEMPKSEGLNKAAAEEKEVVVAPVTETAKPVAETATDAAPAAAPAAVETAVETPAEVKEIKAAFETLLKFVEAKLNKEAVLTENVEPKIDGKGKPQVAPMPSGLKEVTKTESPKGHVSASLKVEAMDENWSVNEKELEAEPKKAKPAQSMPMLMSVDSKEVASEQMNAKVDSKAMSAVKKYFNSFGPGATGEPAKAIDAKSSQNEEVKMLRAALAQEKAEKEALVAKANLNAVADKIYNVVATLRAKNLLPKGKEEAMVDTLTQKFASVEALDGLNTLLSDLTATETADESASADAPKVVPQTILESAQPRNEDAAVELSKIWNK